jgi:hypothetical protein
MRAHLELLRQKFPELAVCDVMETHGDYRFRVIVPREVWQQVGAGADRRHLNYLADRYL